MGQKPTKEEWGERATKSLGGMLSALVTLTKFKTECEQVHFARMHARSYANDLVEALMNKGKPDLHKVLQTTVREIYPDLMKAAQKGVRS
jgi:hypothetical protein